MRTNDRGRPTHCHTHKLRNIAFLCGKFYSINKKTEVSFNLSNFLFLFYSQNEQNSYKNYH